MAITSQQFEQMKARMGSARRTKSTPAREEAPSESATPTANSARVILGIDPSLRGTGYGVIRTGSAPAELLEMGTIKCPASLTRSQCLAKISQLLRALVAKHHPETCAVEGLFFAQNLQTAIIMGEARGAALAAVAESGIPIYEMAPRKVKQAIVGYGAAQKLAVAKMVQRQLNLAELPAPDAADALALALVFAQQQGKFALSPPKQV